MALDDVPPTAVSRNRAMPDLKKMTLESLRELARKVLGPGYSRKSRPELIAALERPGKSPSQPRSAGRAAAARDRGGRSRTPGRSTSAEKAGKATEKVARAAKGAARKAGAVVAGAGKAAAGARKRAAGAKEAKESSPARAGKPGKVAAAVAAVAGAAAGAAAGVAAARRAVKAREKARVKARAAGHAEGPDPDGYFVARVRGEDALRDAPHPMAEAAGEGWSEAEEPSGPAVYDEQLGELAWSYGDDAFVALPRDPRTLFLYWDWSQATLSRGFEGLERPRTQLWIFAREGEAWERVRVLEFALESRGFYVHDLAPGRRYRAEIHVVDRAGRERLLASPSNECALPPSGPSPVVDDRFVRIPWDMPLGRLLGPGHAGVPFADDIRAQLARLSDWSRFSGPTWGGSAGGMGGRPFSPATGPSSPSSPFGGGR
jgi:hypothetical protein